MKPFKVRKRLVHLQRYYNKFKKAPAHSNVRGTMVMRTIEIREIRYKAGRKKAVAIAEKLRKLYGHKLQVFNRGEKVGVRGDLRNY